MIQVYSSLDQGKLLNLVIVQQCFLLISIEKRFFLRNIDSCGGDFPLQTIGRSRSDLPRNTQEEKHLTGQEHQCGAGQKLPGVRMSSLRESKEIACVWYFW